MKRRDLLAAGCCAPLVLRAWAAPVALPASKSLAAELDAALDASRPLVVMVSLHGCAYCEIVRERYLIPRRGEGQPVVQVDMGGSQPLTDLQGARRTHGEMVRAWKVKVAPTLLFLGPGGREVAPRLEGVPNLDFYDGVLAQRLDQARTQTLAARR